MKRTYLFYTCNDCGAHWGEADVVHICHRCNSFAVSVEELPERREADRTEDEPDDDRLMAGDSNGGK